MDEELMQELKDYANEVGDVIEEENPAVGILYMKLFEQFISEILPIKLMMTIQGIEPEDDDTIRAYELMLNTIVDLKKLRGQDKNTGPS